uniref:Uncharacterized protein n=1 Tax=Escherichia coli TaxID=562 RepID=A0A7U1E1A1_ECOLX|nr:hypothetical protein [Escherichia coli]
MAGGVAGGSFVLPPMPIDKVCSSYIFCFVALISNNFAVF